MHIKITFLGGARSVTGSRHLLETNGLKLLIDCGLFQERDLRVRDWESFPVPASSIDALLLTHAHLDHCGYIPRLMKQGFHGPVYCTAATADITKIMVTDTGRIQEQDAENKRKRHEKEKRAGPYPEIPLYTQNDAESCFPLLKPVPYGQETALADGITFKLYDAGHVLGSGMIELKVRQNGEERTFIFSGDIGRIHRPILRDPTFFEHADYVVMESTYADRALPDPEDTLDDFVGVIQSTIEAGGNVIIPTFALERSQDVLYYLSQALYARKLPPVRVYLDSPMAVSITGIFTRYVDLFDAEVKRLMREKKSPFDFPGLHLISTLDESKSINEVEGPAVVMAGSGMCIGGRIKYHLISNISRRESTILFVGYQAEGTLGRVIADGAPEVRILGQTYPVKAKVVQMQGFSSHADSEQLQKWLFNLKQPPRHVFAVHGEERAALALVEAVQHNKGWPATAPEYLQGFTLD
jgi:metallo-beta-lactamase family protein